MLSILTYGTVGRTEGPADRGELDPGIFSLIARIARAIGHARTATHEDRVAAFIVANGGQMSDDIERRIGSGFGSGRF